MLPVTVLLTAPAQAAASKYPLVGPDANVYCNDLTPGSSEYIGSTPEGFVVFTVDGGFVSAVVSLKGWQPNTEYVIRLLQANAPTGCYTADAAVTTNGQGNGTVRVAEPVDGTAAQVIVDTGGLFQRPTYRATVVYPIG